MRGALAAALVLSACAAGARAQGMQSSLPRTHPYNVPTPLADDPSAFVHVPARFGFHAGMLAGLVPGVMLGVPVALAERATAGRASQFSADLIGVPSVYSGVAMHYMTGGPFFLAKTIFWDIPRGLTGAGGRRR